MADDFSSLERLLGLPEGSTKNIDPDKATEQLSKSVNKKATELDKSLKRTDTLDKLSDADLVKTGISAESLERDREIIRNDAFELYRVAKILFDKFMDDAKDRIDMDDRMYTAGFKGVDALSGTIDKLNNMNMKFRQEEEMKNLTIIGEDNGTKEMSPTDWIDFIDTVKEPETDKEEEKSNNIQDAEIIEDDKSEE